MNRHRTQDIAGHPMDAYTCREDQCHLLNLNLISVSIKKLIKGAGRCQGAKHIVLRGGEQIDACPSCLDAKDDEEKKRGEGILFHRREPLNIEGKKRFLKFEILVVYSQLRSMIMSGVILELDRQFQLAIRIIFSHGVRGIVNDQ